MNTTLILAIAIGAAFGFVLDRVGATNPNYIINMLRLKDLHLMRAIVLGIAVASLILMGGILLGFLTPDNMSVKTAYTGVIAGGALLGFGFAISGYCPGTGLTAAATGRKDAWVFVLGGLLGALAYTLSYAWLKGNTVLFEKIAGGKATLGAITGADYPYVLSHYSGEIIGVAIAVAMIAFVWLIRPRG